MLSVLDWALAAEALLLTLVATCTSYNFSLIDYYYFAHTLNVSKMLSQEHKCSSFNKYLVL